MGHWHDHGLMSRTFGQLLAPDMVNFYHLLHWVLMPATQEHRLSYVERITNSYQVRKKPRWMISHWWGNSILDFWVCVSTHAAVRCLDEDTSYWVYAFAGNHWDPDPTTSTDPTVAHIWRALSVSYGMLTVIDKAGEVFNRLWCNYEVLALMQSAEVKPHDIAAMTMAPVGHPTATPKTAAVLTDGLAEEDKETGMNDHLDGKYEQKSKREMLFPARVLAKAFIIDLGKCSTSVTLDYNRLVNSITKGYAVDAAPVQAHQSYALARDALRWRFLMALFQVTIGVDDVAMKKIRGLAVPNGFDSTSIHEEELANSFYEQEKFELALEFYIKSLDIQQQAGSRDPGGTTESTSNRCAAIAQVATTYPKLGNVAKALEHYKQALEMARKSQNTCTQVGICNNVGFFYYNDGDVDNSKKPFR